MKQEHKIVNNENDDLANVAEEAVSPGRMLKEAREIRGLSQQQVADKLNFRSTLVQDIEVDKFNHSIPEAFNRGYLKNYAKVVNIAEADVLASYDQLGVAQRQCAQMQSFSKDREKQTEHNIVMWITYLILAVLVTATVVWWLQTPSEQPEPIVIEAVAALAVENNNTEPTDLSEQKNSSNVNRLQNTESASGLAQIVKDEMKVNAKAENIGKTASLDVEQISLNRGLTDAQVEVNDAQATQADSENELSTAIANVVFTFAGDCWVNIYDATGERIAWGVKQSGYVMRISGQAPFSITLGRPELVQIDYNDVSIDMTAFNAGNIAKFSLPLAP